MKYLYKGQIVTASSKEEAIKVLAEKKEAKGKTSYSTVSIGGKQWMSENLAYDDGGKGITYNPDNKEYYYTLAAAKRVAKKLGWKLPSAEDWNKAAEECGAKCTNPWEVEDKKEYSGGNLKSKLKIKKLPGFHYGNFNYVDASAYYWTSSKQSSISYYRFLSSDNALYSSSCIGTSMFSVRLVK